MIPSLDMSYHNMKCRKELQSQYLSGGLDGIPVSSFVSKFGDLLGTYRGLLVLLLGHHYSILETELTDTMVGRNCTLYYAVVFCAVSC